MNYLRKMSLLLLLVSLTSKISAQEVNSQSPESNICLTNPCFKDVTLEDKTYTGSYLISENKRYQSIYSSQNYGSFYEMYAKANFYEGSDSNLVESFDFIIVNYKGPVRVGFAKINEAKNELHFNKKEGIMGMRLIVNAKNSKNYMNYKIPKSWNVTKNNMKQLNIFRMLIPMDGLGLRGSNQSQVFDSEFYERVGLKVLRKKLVPPGHYDLYKPDYFGPDMTDIASPRFLKELLTFTKDDGGEYGIESKDSNCYTSTMYVK